VSAALLYILMAIPLIFAGVIVFRPADRARHVAMWGATLALLAALAALVRFDWSRAGEFQGVGAVDWLPLLGLRLSVGVDSVALLLIALTALLGPITVLSSFSAIREREKTYYAWLLVLQAAMTGVFAAQDLIFFYICFEFTLIPMYVLISLYGSSNRKRAATKFFLYTFTGSILALAGLLYVVYVNATRDYGSGAWTFDIATLREAAVGMSAVEQGWVLLAMLAGFAVKVPLFPVHTWLPLAHTEAPTAGSVILAGVLLKLGTYALYRFVLPFAPMAAWEYAPLIAVVSIIGILYAGLICWVQVDVKKLVAYSSVAHLGFCVLGLVAFNGIGLSGSVMYMLNHGLSTGALFLLVGMVYERYHTRSMNEIGGLAKRMPVWSTFMVFFALSSVGLPGLNGFVSEFMCLMGAFQASGEHAGLEAGATPGRLGPAYAAVAGLGMIVAAMYILLMVGKVCFGPLVEPEGHGPGAAPAHDHRDDPLPADLSAREITVLAPLAVLCLVLGLYPKPVLASLEAPVNETVAWVLEHSGQARELETDVAARPGEGLDGNEPGPESPGAGTPARADADAVGEGGAS